MLDEVTGKFNRAKLVSLAAIRAHCGSLLSLKVGGDRPTVLKEGSIAQVVAKINF
jgi:hypothetical protein